MPDYVYAVWGIGLWLFYLSFVYFICFGITRWFDWKETEQECCGDSQDPDCGVYWKRCDRD